MCSTVTVLDMTVVYHDLDNFIMENEYDVWALDITDPYNAQEFVDRWGHRTEPLVSPNRGRKDRSCCSGQLKKLEANSENYWFMNSYEFSVEMYCASR